MKNSDSIRCIRKYEKKDGTVSYHAEVRRKNAKPLRESFPTLTKAKNWVRKTESELLEGKYVPDNKARKHTLHDLIEKYTCDYLSKFPRRLKDQIVHLNWWNENYGNQLLIAITPALLTQAKEKLLSEITHKKQNRSNSTVNRYLSSLSRAFTIANKEWQWITENPFRQVSKLKENNSRTRFLSRNELRVLLEACKESRNPHLYGMVLIASTMGLRFGEIVDLRWKHIDFENRFITLEMTKNGDARFVPLSAQVTEYLKLIERSKMPEDFLFPSKDPTKRHPYSLIRKAFQTVTQKIGLKDFRYHDLRHTCASHLAMNGATQSELMEILGHRNPTMTRRYAHFSKGHLGRILQKTSDYLINPPQETS